ncbi:hypothetical protein ACPOL_3712 [Acidisarcina polymorpha]|uniref:Uncharacterized protein n=1 Tax=Acidisarcina polymorpha TaxID=2211140 RepID=A0A2Z5G1D3_9BACT|nr:hypothetical protein ACPOL_3712 [Acidisarcina polymorpha]
MGSKISRTLLIFGWDTIRLCSHNCTVKLNQILLSSPLNRLIEEQFIHTDL